jgi:hypothetical protein
MATGRSSKRRRLRFSGFVVGLTVTLAGCGQDSTASGNTAGTTASGGHAGDGNQSGSGGSSATGGRVSMGGLAGTSGGLAGGSGGSPGGAAAAGAASGGGAQAGGTGGAASAGASGSAGAAGAASDECTRALLDSLLDDYLEALSAGDPASLPLATDVKFTENAQVAQLGMTPFWKNAGDAKYSQRALDTTACSVAAQAVIPENGTDLPVGLRIKVVEAKMTEIETIVVRPGDYTASFAVDSNPAAIIDIADDIGWHDEVPAAERATRQQLTSWVDKYFRAFPSGVCNVTATCRRLENGGGNFSCGTGASCSATTPTTGGELIPRITIVDEVRGIAAGFTIFDYQTTGHLDMHMIKMAGGQVRAVHAILRNTNGQSGWD